MSGRHVDYTYDDLYRLKSETIGLDPVTASNGSINYTYDAVGNRLNRTSTVAAIPTTTSTFNTNDQLGGDTYDSNGSTTGSAGNTYVYDFENRIKSVNSGQIVFVYDGDGNRVAKTVGGVTTKFLVDTNSPTGYEQVVEEIVGSTVQRVYEHGQSLISQTQLISGNWVTSFYGYDGHGSVRLLTDSVGAITDTNTYDAFGNSIESLGTTPNNYLYAGDQLDATLGFYYLRARYMNPSTGRFWTMDGFEGTRFEPLGLHKYLYAEGNPPNKVDRSGRSATSTVEVAEVALLLNTLANLALSLVLSAIVEKVTTKIEEDRNSELCKKGGGIPLYRTMKADWSGLSPLVEQSKRGLGVKTEDPSPDIVPDENGVVNPLSGGMSVFPDTFLTLPKFKLSPRFGGDNTKPDPVWCINSAFVYGTTGLQYRPDSATHGVIEPNRAMPLVTYQQYLTATQPYWIKITDQK